ncbi:MAG TPA: redoxin domain-containing protein [Planctomycetaceae bacterium]|nr:redoxin domain-containing protein [Planctomycetaceae bacterium]
MAVPDECTRSRVGTHAPEIALPDLSGREHRLADYAGHWLLLVFHRHLG